MKRNRVEGSGGRLVAVSAYGQIGFRVARGSKMHFLVVAEDGNGARVDTVFVGSRTVGYGNCQSESRRRLIG
jgi:hypothetical protein